MVYAPDAILINEKVSVVELKKSGIKETLVLASSLPQFAESVSTKTIKTYRTHAIKCNSGIVANPNRFYAKTEFLRAKPKFLNCNRDD
jgi:hypothetical protein